MPVSAPFSAHIKNFYDLKTSFQAVQKLYSICMYIINCEMNII